MPKAALAREYGISRETVYSYLRAGSPSSSAADSDGVSTLSALVGALPVDTKPMLTLTLFNSLLAVSTYIEKPLPG